MHSQYAFRIDLSIASIAFEHVDTRTADKSVVAVIACQPVVVGAAVELVVAVSAVEGVVEGTALHQIVATASGQGVGGGLGTAGENVVQVVDLVVADVVMINTADVAGAVIGIDGVGGDDVTAQVDQRFGCCGFLRRIARRCFMPCC
mgnify:CR=1 FL=1